MNILKHRTIFIDPQFFMSELEKWVEKDSESFRELDLEFFSESWAEGRYSGMQRLLHQIERMLADG